MELRATSFAPQRTTLRANPLGIDAGRAGGLPAVVRTRDFFPSLMRQVYGQDRISAVLSAVSPGTRTRYVADRNHWGQFIRGSQLAPCIWRTIPDWGDNSIDYIMFESKILANAPDTIGGEIAGIMFWHLLVGIPDFALGGALYDQVMKSVRRNSRVDRKIPATLEVLPAIASHQ